MTLPFAIPVGWAILHSLWIGAAAAAVVRLTLQVTRAAQTRYLAACAALFLTMASFVVTIAMYVPADPTQASAIGFGLPKQTLIDGGVIEAPQGWNQVERLLPWLTVCWMAGVVIFQARSVASWIAARRLSRRGVCSAPDVWQQRLRTLSAQLQVSRPVLLLESAIMSGPVVLGFLRPTILVPLGMLAGMPVAQVEAILLHELAHIRRHDYFVNLVQRAIEGFLFYHPAVWWISSVIRSEREHCCDDLAVAASGNAYEYAVALTTLEQSREATALAATGGNLMIRIRRLLNQTQEESYAALAPIALTGILMLASAGGLAAGWAPQQSDTKPAESPYTKWVKEDVVYIIADAEKAAFERLTTDEERQYFIEQFWSRRDPTPGTRENEFQLEHYRRIGYAAGRFKGEGVSGWRTDRGRYYILYGPADEIESHPESNPPRENWRYRMVAGVGDNIEIEFTDATGKGQLRVKEVRRYTR